MKQILKRAGVFTSALAISLSSLFVLAVPMAHAATVTWDYDGTCDGNWSTADCWSGNALPTSADVVDFPSELADLNNDVVVDADVTVAGITFSGAFDSATEKYTIAPAVAQTITVTGATPSIANSGTGADADQSISAQIIFDGVGGAAASITNSSNTSAVLSLGAIQTANGVTVTYTSAAGSPSEDNRIVVGALTSLGDIVIAAGEVEFSAANSYSGITTIQSGGVLILSGAGTLGTTGAKTIINDGGTLQLDPTISASSSAEIIEVVGVGTTTSQTGSGAIVDLKAGGTFVFSAVSDLTASAVVCAVDTAILNFSPAVVVDTLTDKILYGSNDADCIGDTTNAGTALPTYTGPPPPPTSADCTSPTTLASGTVGATECAQITTTYTGDVTVTAGGVLIVDGMLTGNATVNGTLKGSGDVTGNVSLTSTGTLAPGNSPGCLAIVGNLTFVSGSSYDVEINGNTACTEYDQAQVTGAVDVTDATLNATAFSGFDLSTLTIGDELIIIDNDTAVDAVTGEFTGLNELTIVTIGTSEFEISYVGGDGNDVTLTYISENTGGGGGGGAGGSGGTPTPVATPATPDTGFQALMTNPATIMFSTTAVAGAILAIARKYNLLNKIKG